MRLGVGIRDWDSGLGFGSRLELRFGTGDLDCGLEIGYWGLGLGIAIGDCDWKLESG